MKNILFVFLLISSALFAQQNDKKWDKVIAFENEGKIKSANEIVLKIYSKAITDKDEAEIIKCFFYQSKYLQVVDENAQTKILNNLKTDINRVSTPSKAILNLVYAKCLTDYYARNEYQIKKRTNTTTLNEDFLTWTEKNFTDQINTSLKQTLESESILKSTPLIKYESIFDYSTLEKFKTQNLYEYLLKENIALYSQKVHQWEIQKKEFDSYTKQLLGKSTDFIALNFDFVTNENLRSLLNLYQKQEKANPNIDNQLERLLYCKTNLVDSIEDYTRALITLQKSTNDETSIQKIQLIRAIFLSQQASKETHPDYNIKAITILDSILNKNSNTNAYQSAIQQKDFIISKSITVQLKKNSYSDENTRAFIQYKNVDHLKVSFFKISQNRINEFRNSPLHKDSLVNVIIEKQKAITSSSYSLINKKDYFQYSTEVLLPQLKTGNYLVYFESDSNSKETKAFAYETITISNIALLASQKNKTESFQVLDRKTGKPLENVSIKLLNQTIKTDKNGFASHDKENNNYNYEPLLLTTDNDTILIVKNYIRYNRDYATDVEEESKGKGKVELYLDRAIYRPGQTVFYKGIAIQKKQNKTNVVAKISFKISVRDANYKTFKEFEVTTNEFGSFSGEFALPKTGLTGNFSIFASEPKDIKKDVIYNKKNEEHPFWDNVDFETSQNSFRVEEYKRPKFEIVFEPKKKTFQIDQTIKVDGTAKAFAGSSISDAKVTYSVTRYTSYFRNYYGQEENEVVATGETKTDVSGKFVIDFIALSSKNAIKEQLPVFNYIVKSSVTDINGETHEAQTTVKVGYHDLMLNITAPSRIETKNEIEISTTNLNGEFLAARGEIKIYFVSPFSNKLKARVFPRPDIESISDQEFEKLFPYENNQKPVNKESETLVYSKNIDSSKDKKLVLDFISNYKSGNYRIVFSAKDSFNNAIETSKDIVLFQSNDKLNPGTLITANQINDDAKKDGFALIKLTSIVPELYVTVSGNYESKMFFQKIYHLENHEVTIKVLLKNEFNKSLKIGLESVFENESFGKDIEVTLKIKEPKLDFNVETFRSKIQPASNENWSFKLNALNTKSQAEVLASMYDSSLDQFTKSDWGTLGFYDYNYNEVNSKSPLGFEKTYINVRNLNLISNRLDFKTETTKLMWFGFDFNNKNSTAYLQREYQKQINKKYKKPINAKNISGVVRDLSNLSLLGVSIAVKGTPRSTTTDYDGFYEIEAAPNEELIFTYIGFKEQSIKVAKNKIIDIALTPEESTLSEVVVVGYGTQKKSMLTGAVASVRPQNEVVQEDNNVYNTAGIEDSLETRVSGLKIRGTGSITGKNPIYIVDGQIVSDINNINPKDILSIEVLKDEKATVLYGSKGANGVIIVTTKAALEALTQVKARKNLSETAFFLPNLRTDSNGKVSFNFTSPKALTAWKLRLLAHNKEAVTGYMEKSVVTQKELMVLPNFPRFFREKDTIVISAKISNITDQAKTGIAILQFFDAITMQPIDSKMLNAKNVKNFTIEPFGNTTASWTISIPEGLQGVQYKILAKSGNYSDGEENILPVLTNNMLVTESIPIWVRENSTKEYTFENLKNNTSPTLKNHQFTLEYTSNPSWIAIQSLPYLMEYEHECAEQTFARFYANVLASEIISSNPKIATVFEEWRKNGKLNSKLEENEELKSIILAETPWLNDAQSEDEKKKNLALLFDLEKMKTSQEATFDKLKQKQRPSGAFSWFDGSDENEYITRHILAGLGHLSKLSKTEYSNQKIDAIAKTGIPFLDAKFLQYYKNSIKDLKPTEKLIWGNPYSDLHYLYTRSFYLEKYPFSDTLNKATKLYLETAKKDWLKYSLYEKGLAALTLNRFGESETAKKIIESLKETSSNNEDWGMYWIANKAGWYWYQAPIETQALLIEAFAEVNHDTKSVDAMRVWLLKNKQTKNWPTTKSTTEAVYALLMQGNDWLSVKDNTVIKIGDEKILTKKLSENEKEAETGYIKLNWKADEIKKDMAKISIQNKSKVPAFGGVYWQYFEDLDKIKNNSGSVLSVSKELYLKKNSLKGDELERITNNNPLKTGDLVTVRLVITSKEDMEFVHLKDMIASCFEPVNVLSEYKYKDRLGYYMSTKDVATHFFFDRIDKGTYVIEYDIRVNNSGEFSNGITTIQSMYAPEFASHTKGIRVNVN